MDYLMRNLPIIIAVLSAILSVVAVLLQEREKTVAERSAKEEKQSANKFQNEARSANIELKSLQKATIDKASKIEKLQDQLLKANDLLYNNQVEMTNQVTGGGVTPLITPGFPSTNGDVITFDVSNTGRYPIYDLEIFIIDLTYLSKLEFTPVKDRANLIAQHTKNFTLGTISKSQTVNFAGLTISNNQNDINIRVVASWRGGNLTNNFKFRRVNGSLEMAK